MTAMPTILKKDLERKQYIVNVDYEQVQRMIDKICWNFVRSHGGDWEELRSVANEGFMEAWSRYDQRKAQFTTYCWWWVWGLLMKQNEKKMKQPAPLGKPEGVANESYGLASLSEDANLVIRVLFNTVQVDDKAMIRKGMKVRQSIRAQLVERLEWTGRRVAESFDEIREALG